MSEEDEKTPSSARLKKIEKRLARLRHVLEIQSGIRSAPGTTRNIAICNAGLVSGLTKEVIYEHFSKHGVITDIILLPGKSCCFVSYKTPESALSAYKAFNGRLGIAQDKKVIYLLFVEQVPSINDQRVWDELPAGLILIDEFIDTTEEEKLLKLCDFQLGTSSSMKHRQVKHFGFEFRYDINNVDKNKPLSATIPPETLFLWDKLHHYYPEFSDFNPDQLTVNHYAPGQGIPHHIDTHSAFEDPIVSLSLGSPIVMEFKNEDKHICVLLPRRSLLVMSKESRYQWTHGIVPRQFDFIQNKSDVGFTCLKRDTRISFTFRKILQGECTCMFKSKCDSYKKSHDINDKVAPQLEALHVHEVYENIADHFSDTRHKPWPNVIEFLQSFQYGDVVIDVGCGNGKYLKNNPHIYDVGCDRSSNLTDICRGKKIEAFIADCLSVPLNDNSADGVISIAVIHHLATEQRRLKAIGEIVRVLKVEGKALIYVWAHDQVRNEQKSSYIMQDRKNRKENNMQNGSHLTGSKDVMLPSGKVELPVHTNRSNFQAQDILVPWKLKDENQTTFLRFYHVFEEHELENLLKKFDNVQVLKSYYDQGNWCVIFKKLV